MDSLSTLLTGRMRLTNETPNISSDPNLLFIPSLCFPQNHYFNSLNVPSLFPLNDSNQITKANKNTKITNTNSTLVEFSQTTKAQHQTGVAQSYPSFFSNGEEQIKKLRTREDKNTLEKVVEIIDQEKLKTNMSKNLKDTVSKQQNTFRIPNLFTSQEKPSQLSTVFSDVPTGKFNEIMERSYVLGLLLLLSSLQTPKMNNFNEDWKTSCTILQKSNDSTLLEKGSSFYSPTIHQSENQNDFPNATSNPETPKFVDQQKDKIRTENLSDVFQSSVIPRSTEQDTAQVNNDQQSNLQATQNSESLHESETDGKLIVELQEEEKDQTINNNISKVGEVKSSEEEKAKESAELSNQEEREQEAGKDKTKKSKRGRKPNKRGKKTQEGDVAANEKSKTKKRSRRYRKAKKEEEDEDDFDFLEEWEQIPEELLLGEDDLKLGVNSEDGNTRVGTEFQAKLFPFGSRKEVERKPKLKWAPNMVEEVQRNRYYSKIATILGRSDITNEALALKILIEFDMDFKEALEEIRNNLRFYKGHFNPRSKILRSGRFY